MTRAARLLCDALLALAGNVRVARARSVPWVSMEMAGRRHCIRMMIEGAEAANIAARLVTTLPDHEFAIRGLLVADLVGEIGAPIFGHAIIDVEALTFAEPRLAKRTHQPRPDTRFRSPSARRSSSCALPEGPGSGRAPRSDKPDSSRAINSVTLSSSSASSAGLDGTTSAG